MSKLDHFRGTFSLLMSQRGIRWNFWLVARCLLVFARCSLVFARCSLLFAHCLLLSARCSLFFAHCLLLSARCSLLFARCSTRNSEHFFLGGGKSKQKSSPYETGNFRQSLWVLMTKNLKVLYLELLQFLSYTSNMVLFTN